MARSLPQFDDFLDARRAFDQQLNELDERLTEQIEQRTLAADVVLRELMDAAETIPITSELLDAARRRSDVGNPPGKRGSLGDALNWEALLSASPSGEDLHLVTEDGDFVSSMDRERIAGFLAEEWQQAKRANVKLYRRISALFEDEFPAISVASEFEKELRIRRLVETPVLPERTRPSAR